MSGIVRFSFHVRLRLVLGCVIPHAIPHLFRTYIFSISHAQAIDGKLRTWRPWNMPLRLRKPNLGGGACVCQTENPSGRLAFATKAWSNGGCSPACGVHPHTNLQVFIDALGSTCLNSKLPRCWLAWRSPRDKTLSCATLSGNGGRRDLAGTSSVRGAGYEPPPRRLFAQAIFYGDLRVVRVLGDCFFAS